MQEVIVSLRQNGRVVIPASIRKSLGLEEDQRLRLYLEGQKIVLEKTDNMIREIKDRFSSIKESLSEELIQDRRKDSEKGK